MRHRQVEKIVLHRVACRRNAEAQRLAPLHPELIVQLRCEAAPATAIAQLDRQQDEHADEIQARDVLKCHLLKLVVFV